MIFFNYAKKKTLALNYLHRKFSVIKYPKLHSAKQKEKKERYDTFQKFYVIYLSISVRTRDRTLQLRDK